MLSPSSVDIKYWSLPAEDALNTLQSAPDGLSGAEAGRRLKVFGYNEMVVPRRLTVLRLFLSQFTNPLVLILIFAAIVSATAAEWTDAAVVLLIVLGSGIITFFQEYRAGRAVEALRARLVPRTQVVRKGHTALIPSRQLAPGDIVVLSAGSLIPADGLILEAKDCYVNQAVLTGETFPVEKRAGVVNEATALVDRTNCVFLGTTVRTGSARMLVVQTGKRTSYGQIAERLNLRPPETAFERGIRRFGYLLTQVMAVLIMVVFAVNVITEKPPIDALLFAIALAVGISPELLPAIITINLSKGARKMARRGVIVRRLNAIENFGSMDVLCTDKTGTLTEGVIQLDAALDAEGTSSEKVFELAYWNATFQSGMANPLDEAIKNKQQLDAGPVFKLDEIPYDFVRKRLSVAIDHAGDVRMITKGALDNVLAVCTRVQRGTSETALEEQELAGIRKRFVQWSEQGFRVLGVAEKKLDKQVRLTREDESEMTFLGFLLFFDPPKIGVHQAIEDLSQLGVTIKLITGDNRFVAEHVARTVGLTIEGIVTGAELQSLPDEALWRRAETANLFVEVDPNQKERIIRALQKMGHVVGFLGDGINDAPALHDADVGISVDGAVEVAREAADIVLLKQELKVLKDGIREGRRTFANSLKYVFTTTSANLGNMLSMAGASVFLPFLPLLPKQILLNNFLSDFPALAIAGDNVDKEWVAKPHRWNVGFIRSFMIIFGLISSCFDFITFGVLLWWMPGSPAAFQTGWFIESLMTELVVALIVRTQLPVFRSKPGFWLLWSTVFVVLTTIVMPYLPFSRVMGFVPLPLDLLGALLGITMLYAFTTELAKRWYFKRMPVHGV